MNQATEARVEKWVRCGRVLITYQSIAAAAGWWLGKTRLVENLVKRTLSNLSVA